MLEELGQPDGKESGKLTKKELIMWNMCSGDKVMKPKTASLFRMGILSAMAYARDSEVYSDFDMDIFSEHQFLGMEYGERMSSLYFVWNALTDETVPEPEITAWAEATVYSVFRLIDYELELEENGDGMWEGEDSGTLWRDSVNNAARENGIDLEDWGDKVFALADTVLWDRDWQLDDIAAIDNPQWAILGIEPVSYFNSEVDTMMILEADLMFDQWAEGW